MNNNKIKIDIRGAGSDHICPVDPDDRELRHMLIHTLDQLFLSTIRVNLQKDTAIILQSVDFPKIVTRNIIWAKHLERYGKFMKTSELKAFSSEHLLNLYASGQTSFSKEIPYNNANNSCEWLTVTALFSTEESIPYATVIVRKSSGEHLLNSIIDLYVYSTCDYFIYLDAKNNSYTSFSRSDNGTPLPPAICTDYSSEIVKYANDFVVPEDREKVIFEMGLDRVLEKLSCQPNHTFTCGVIDPIRGYTRKRLMYQYYNRQMQMILLCRTDITDVYLENQKNKNELKAAKQLAKMDPLTKLYNPQGIFEEIALSLENTKERCALLFMDLDNFKNVNDTLGHAAEDDLLCKTAEALRANVRQCDLIARIGGDEFLIFFRDINSIDGIKQRARRLNEAICELSLSPDILISCSIGIAISPTDGTDYTTLMKCADKRMYLAKNKGKNQFSLD